MWEARQPETKRHRDMGKLGNGSRIDSLIPNKAADGKASPTHAAHHAAGQALSAWAAGIAVWVGHGNWLGRAGAHKRVLSAVAVAVAHGYVDRGPRRHVEVVNVVGYRGSRVEEEEIADAVAGDDSSSRGSIGGGGGGVDVLVGVGGGDVMMMPGWWRGRVRGARRRDADRSRRLGRRLGDGDRTKGAGDGGARRCGLRTGSWGRRRVDERCG